MLCVSASGRAQSRAFDVAGGALGGSASESLEMSGTHKREDEEVTPEEMAALLKGLRKNAARNSDPDIVATSEGRDAAAYHAPPAPPPAAVDKTVSNGEVLLSTTLRREVASLERAPAAHTGPTVDAARVTVPAARAAGASRDPAPSAIETTVSTRRRSRSLLVWAAAGAAGLLVIGLAVLLGRGRGGHATSAVPSATVSSAAAATAPSAPGTASSSHVVSAPLAPASQEPEVATSPRRSPHAHAAQTSKTPRPNAQPSATVREDVNRTF